MSWKGLFTFLWSIQVRPSLGPGGHIAWDHFPETQGAGDPLPFPLLSPARRGNARQKPQQENTLFSVTMTGAKDDISVPAMDGNRLAEGEVMAYEGRLMVEKHAD